MKCFKKKTPERGTEIFEPDDLASNNLKSQKTIRRNATDGFLFN